MAVADAAVAAARPARAHSPARIGLICAAAASIEWYDFFIYGTAAALVFPRLFFPATLSPLVAQLASFSTFAVGFIARPVGGILFGHFGDLLGRKRALVVALVMMGLASALVGALPSYARIGAAAPLILVVLRFCQGLAVGGLWGGAALLAVENAPPDKRGFYGSLPQLGIPSGMILANLAVLLMTAAVSPDAFLAWGWRAPFLLSVVLVAIGIYIQGRLEETPEFKGAMQAGQASARRARSPVLQVLARNPKEVVLAAGSFVATNGLFYIFSTFATAYAVTTLHLPRAEILWAILLAFMIDLPTLVFAGALSDRVGRRAVYLAGGLLGLPCGFLAWRLIDTGSFPLMVLGVALGMAPTGLMAGGQPALFAELFPPELRYSGASIGYQLGAIVAGGFAPMIATGLIERFHSSAWIAGYGALLCVVTIVSVILLGERRKPASPGPAP
jgi:metabolite-proton symporter